MRYALLVAAAVVTSLPALAGAYYLTLPDCEKEVFFTSSPRTVHEYIEREATSRWMSRRHAACLAGGLPRNQMYSCVDSIYRDMHTHVVEHRMKQLRSGWTRAEQERLSTYLTAVLKRIESYRENLKGESRRESR